MSSISIHAPTRGATCRTLCCGLHFRHFNPRTHEGCDKEVKAVTFDLFLFQSTHPRGVRLSAAFFFISIKYISIHAPTRGATSNSLHQIRSFSISIHAPTRGATIVYHIYSVLSIFQSTHPRGVRLGTSRIEFGHEPISIHAPTRGATLNNRHTLSQVRRFQSTHPRGVRRSASVQFNFC